jgi:hypothetical protein
MSSKLLIFMRLHCHSSKDCLNIFWHTVPAADMLACPQDRFPVIGFILAQIVLNFASKY